MGRKAPAYIAAMLGRRHGKSTATARTINVAMSAPYSGWNGMSGFGQTKEKFCGYDVYLANNKRLTELMCTTQFVPNTLVRYRTWVSPTALIYHESKAVALVFWLRKCSKRELEEAIATLVMVQDAPIVLLRSFHRE